MKSAVMLFLDDPLPVLAAAGEPIATPDALAIALVRDTLRNLADVDADVYLFIAPDEDKDRVRELLGPGGYKIAQALGRNLRAQKRNAFRLVFSKGCERALLLANAMPDLPAHAVQSALETLGWKCCCLGPVPGADGQPDRIYALGFDFEGYSTDALDMVDDQRPGHFGRLETLLLFYERKVKALTPYSPVASLADTSALAARTRDTRFALLPSARLAAERAEQ
jgi:hypothetical protein